MKRLQRKLYKEDQLIDELDPDAPTRQRKLLDDKDSEFERKFLRNLFLLIRCGDFDKACDLCKETGNFLRSAILQGCVEYRDPLIDENNAELGVMGTKRKQLWKKMCYELSKQTELDPYERALYGALCGDFQSVLHVCETWEDYLWAYCNAICEYQITTNLKQLKKIDPSQDIVIPSIESISLSSVLESLVHSDNELLRTVDIVYSEALMNDDIFSSFTGELVPITDAPSEWDLYQIRALEWMKSSDDLKYDIIFKGNILYRRFLLRGRLNAAQALNLRLSSSIVITRDMVENDDGVEQDRRFRHATEFLGYSSLCIGYTRYENWKNIMSSSLNDVMDKSNLMGKRQWKLEVQTAVEECVSTFYELIQGSWLHPDTLFVSEADDPVTYKELMKIRNMYIPELVCLLHKVYYDTHMLFPRNLHACMELSCIVADDEKKIYETFLITDRMPEYLKMVRQASIAMLGSYHSQSNESLWNI
ncbi:hypothetical protein PCK2_000107 [Pneumocystis canis]|nr:hypothetical protein PCK2_000107 [Pneumocystis canis]